VDPGQSASWRNLENNVLSSLNQLVRNFIVSVCVLGGGGEMLPPPSPTHGGTWSNHTYVALALFSLLATCVVF
jgi:hypothetical protein